jgi:ABC-type lipoprotein export system ATPase subunit
MNSIEHEIIKDYPLGTTMVHALRGITFSIAQGDLVGLMGPSGSGKTTFVFSTHDPNVLRYAKRIVTIKDGILGN